MAIARKHRQRQSMALLVLQLVAAVVHIVPRLVYAERSIRTTTRLVAYLADLGPLWVVLFGGSSVFLIVMMWKRSGEWVAHLVCAAVWVMYCVGLWIGALADHPHGTVFFPIVATIVVTLHVILALSYSDDAIYAEVHQK